MKTTTITLAALAAVMSTPALACGMMQQTATTGSTAQQAPAMGGMMCSRPTAAAQTPPAQPGQQAQPSGGCPCCRNMAMMNPNQSMPGMQGMPNMGGSQQGTPSPSPQTPEQPKR